MYQNLISSKGTIYIYMNYIFVTRVIFKQKSRLVVLAENVKIQYFFKKIFKSYVYDLVDNDTVKIQKENVVK